MTDRRLPVFVALLVAAGCGSSDYGEPTSSTTIELDQTGGFAGQSQARAVHIVGNLATYVAGDAQVQVTIPTSDVAAIVHALEDIDFLTLDADYSVCTPVISDMPSVTIRASLSGGGNTVRHYLGCHGGMFDRLQALDQVIYDRSGYTAWAATR